MPQHQEASAWSDRLRRLRDAVPGLSQAKVATHLGIKPSSVAQWELGRSRPAINKLGRLAVLYGVELAELCGDDLPNPASAAALASRWGQHGVTEIVERHMQLRELIVAWPSLTEREREAVMTLVTGLVSQR